MEYSLNARYAEVAKSKVIVLTYDNQSLNIDTSHIMAVSEDTKVVTIETKQNVYILNHLPKYLYDIFTAQLRTIWFT